MMTMTLVTEQEESAEPYRSIEKEPLNTDPGTDPETDLPGGGKGGRNDPKAMAAAHEAARREAQKLEMGRGEAIAEWLDQAVIEEVRLSVLQAEKTAAKLSAEPSRELPSHVDPHLLHEAGWGVIFPESMAADLEEALSDLLSARGAQAGERFKKFSCLPGESARSFLERLGEAPGVIDPQRVPYYLLIAGSPQDIPFELQYQLSINHAVGRVFFEDLASYRSYAQHLAAAEKRRLDAVRRFALFSVQHEDDPATDQLARFLVEPLERNLAEASPSWQVEVWRKERAYKRDLGRLLGGDATPQLLLVACHGLASGFDAPGQRELQGALICQDRPADGTVSAEHCFSAADVAAQAQLEGQIAVLLACYGAGTPIEDSYPARGTSLGQPVVRKALAPQPFLAKLPQTLLARGAAAVLGHVDRGWTLSFSWLLDGQLREAPGSFEDVLRQLICGERLGHALRPLYRRYTALAAHLAPSVERFLAGETVDLEQLRLLRLAVNDARNFVILGDPAVYAGGQRNGG